MHAVYKIQSTEINTINIINTNTNKDKTSNKLETGKGSDVHASDSSDKSYKLIGITIMVYNDDKQCRRL